MHKSTINFLKSKGFSSKNQDTMICELSKNSGIIVSCYNGLGDTEEEEEEERYEFTLNFLSEETGDPQLLFCGLSQTKLMEKFDLMYQVSYNLHSFFKNHNF